MLQLANVPFLLAQNNSTTPNFNVDLTGKPNGIWESGDVNRRGSLCSADSNDNCVQFTITLDKNAAGLEFEIVDGPVPSGSMGYQISCGKQMPVGQPICLEGTGPHILTLCMPGNAKGRFVIKSIAAFEPQPDFSVTTGCRAVLRAPIAFEEASITWTDLTGGGKYLSYLSFPNGKANPVITPTGTVPEYVDYQVCGRSVASPCSTLPYCDVVRVYFYPPPTITLGPSPAIICPGGSGVQLSGTVSGGGTNLQYIWTDASGRVVGNQLNYTAQTVGTYTLEVRNANYPDCEKFSSSITVVNNLSVNAGPDQLVCSSATVSLAGAVTAATGGTWSGGTGSFSDRNDLKATYTPSTADINAGSVRLTLTTTGNGSCTAIKDEVLITFYKMEVNVTGTPVICNGTLGSITANVTGAQGSVFYLWNTGQTTATISGKTAGTYTVHVSDQKGCTISKSFTISAVSGPTGFTATPLSSSCGNSNGEVSITGVTGGTAPYSYSKDATNFQTASTFTDLAAGNYTITVKDKNGCTFAKSVNVTNVAGPTAVSATTQAASCNNNDGTITAGTVTGGTSPYTYSIDGVNFTTSNTFTGLASGTYTVTAQDARGCKVTTSVTIGKNLLSGFTVSTTTSTCGSSNGGISVSDVTGGFAPYTYSVGGVFQSGASFASLAAGTYTVTVKDARGCVSSKSVTIGNVAGPSNFTVSATPSSCGNPNGSITAGAVTGGTASYTYSIDGQSFQSSGNFTNLLAGNYTITVKDANGCTYAKQLTVTNIAGPAFTATAKSSTCGGPNGSITVSNVTGGTAPYSYSKDGGTTYQTGTTFSALAAGNYTITIKDGNGCLNTRAVEVTNVAGPTGVALAPTSSTCGASNGSIAVGTVTGGTAPYTYALNASTTFQAGTSFSGLAAGDYTVKVKDANGCITSRTVAVGNVAGPTDLAASNKAATCGASNGELTVTGVTGGTAPYKYSKDGISFQDAATFEGLAIGSHTITVKDANGCTFAEAYTITNIAGPTAVAATSTTASCADNDGSITAGTVTGGTAPYTYAITGRSFQASAIFTAVASGTYTLTARDNNGCTVTRQITVTKTAPTAFTASTTSSTCGASNGQLSVTAVTGGTAPYTYSINGTSFQSAAAFNALLAGTYTVTVKDAKGCTFSKAVQVGNITGPSDLVATAKSTTCGNSNGGITVSTVTGGTAPYTYALNNGNFQSTNTFTALAAGTYTVTVKDAKDCVFSEEIAVVDIAGPAFTATAQATTCGNSNGSIVISGVAGGTAPYTYSKDGSTFQSSTTFGGLAAGTYAISVKDANGCVATKSVVLEDKAGPTDLALRNTSSTCGSNNGKLEVTGVTGGTAPYSYSVNGTNFQSAPAFENMLAGEYTVTAKDANGCITTKKINIENVAGPTNLTASVTATTCGASNGTVTLTGVTGGTAPYTYSKNGVNFQSDDTFSALTAGQHTITVKDANGCTFAKSFTITNIAGPTAATASSLPASCSDNDGSITAGTVTGGTAPYTYSINGTSFKTEKVFAGLASGNYTLTVKDANGCTITNAVTVGKNVPTSFTHSTVSSTCGASNGQFTITGVTGGAAPYAYSLDGNSFRSSDTFTALAAGTYQVSVRDAKGCIYTGSVQVSNIAGPAFTATAQKTTCGNSNGSIRISNVSGGTAPYTYSKDGNNFQTGTTFSGLVAGDYTITTKDANGCISSTVVKLEDIAGPSAFQLTATTTTCGNSNGSIAVGTVTGGTAPYIYALNGSTTFQSGTNFSALAAGKHTITVKDANGCTLVQEITLENVPGPAGLTLAGTSTTCGASNGKVEVSGVEGGTAPYMFSLNGSPFQSATTFANLAVDKYAVTVRDANGCTFVKEITLSNIAGPTAVAATSLPATCADNDGSITAGAVTGGTAPYTYSIDGTNFKSATLFGALASGNYTLTAKDANGCTVTRSVAVGKNVPTSFTSTTVSSACGSNDGALTITDVTGGTAPYKYSLDGIAFQESATFRTLNAGSYTVTVKDANGCTFADQVQVNNQGGPSDLVAAATSTTCGNSNGGISITSVSGGKAPYTYSLDGTNYQTAASFATLLAGDYQISVKDANGCIYTEEVVVTDLAAPTFTAAPKTSTCGNPNGSITIGDFVGGTAPFQFSRDGVNFQSSTTFSGLAAGAYTITARDKNGCLRTVEVVLENIAGPTDFTLASAASTCGNSNGSITASAVKGGTAPFTYSINGTNFQTSPAFEAVLAGEYTVTVKDANGCIITKNIRVDNIAGPTNLAASLTSSTCGASNGSLTVTGVTGGTAPYTYSKDGKTFQQGAAFSALLAGQYAITVKDANGCTFARTFTLTDIAGPTAIAATTRAATCADNDGSISIGGITGGTAPYKYSIDGTTFKTETAFSALASGNYTITVKDANGCTFSREIVVEKNVTTSFTHTTVSSTCGDRNGQFTVSGVQGGTAPYTYSIGGGSYQASATFTALAAGTYVVSVKDVNGCVFTGEVQLNDVAGPAFVATAQASTCGNSNGQVRVSEVTGGTAPYSYSIDGTTFQASATFVNLAAGSYNITTKDANGCSTVKAVEVGNIAGPSNLALQIASSTCGNSTGSISIGAVTDGTAPYTYSINGTTFQAQTLFGSLAAGEYTVTVKDANGCTFAVKAAVENINGPTNFTATPVASRCGASNGELTVGEVTGGTAPYKYSTDGKSFQTSAIFSALAAGDHTITVKDVNGCTFAKTFTITNIAGPTAIAATTLPATCADNNGTITAGEVSGGTAPYTYSINGSSFQVGKVFTAVASGTYTLTVKDANGCTVTTTAVVTKNTPTAFTSTTVSSTCGANNGGITVTGVTGGTAPYTYSANGTTFQQAATFTALLAGSHTITVKDANGCTFAAQVQVNDVAGPADLVASVEVSTCGESNGSITIASVQGGATPYTYSLDGITYQTAATFTALAAATYEVSVKDAKGCVYKEQVQVENASGPTFTATAKASTCGNSNGTISIKDVTGAAAPYTYSINGANYQTAATFNNLAAGTYNVSAKDANGCLNTVTVVIESSTGPAGFKLASATATCGEANGTITFGTVDGGTAPFSYAINGTDFQSSPAFEAVAAGTYTAMVKDANGCIVTKEVVIGNVAGITDFRTANTTSACSANTGTITVEAVNGGTAPYLYSLDGQNFQTVATFRALAPQAYTVYVKDANGCSTSASVTIGTNAPTAAALTSSPANCGASTGSITVGTVTGGTAPYSYAINGYTYQASASFTELAPGAYQVSVKDAAGCVFTQEATVTSVGSLGSPQVQVTPVGCGQNGGQVVVSGVTGGTGAYTYSLDGVTFSASATFSNVVAGQYTLTVKDAGNCSITVPVEVAQVSSQLARVKDESCFGAADGEIAITATGTTDETEYSIDNGKTFHKNAVFPNLPQGTYQVITRFTPTCSISLGKVDVKGPTEIVAVVTPVAVSIGQESSGSATISSVTGGTAPYKYKLDNGSFTTSTELFNLGSGEHTLLVQDANGCTTVLTFSIDSITELEIPNGFTPNGDGLNDKWVIKNLALLYPRCRVTVYNRWGSPVFSSRGYTKEWDGMHNGKKLPDGTYYTIIELGDGQAPMKRSVTIMR
ncbi:gliding motility-associated C-terminal domain-containing protein [Pontibacter akesuensis]|uniref:gliding motility-associated C-terminal domain-containing protein n=1 Tax=Pontibacter akesuensis TaxID=388950 RepID=UPI00083B29CD|nr:gliding motility-associated C-terminal domain-containing protein [Pontibacter akesuensis]GHA55997.1 hypothetical protein GCM10007389_04420 [Pontibacter akesuensis]